MSTTVRSIAPALGARSLTAVPVTAAVPGERAGLAATASLTAALAPAGGAGWQ
ncbi:hypothetical protein [Streptosporangium sp. OZ121]|uniref:hypothetical protein n=1 Tax=Streptosporangium sp. OZ121 TaxID=3444183 RepID=UPI003F797CC1